MVNENSDTCLGGHCLCSPRSVFEIESDALNAAPICTSVDFNHCTCIYIATLHVRCAGREERLRNWTGGKQGVHHTFIHTWPQQGIAKIALILINLSWILILLFLYICHMQFVIYGGFFYYFLHLYLKIKKKFKFDSGFFLQTWKANFISFAVKNHPIIYQVLFRSLKPNLK